MVECTFELNGKPMSLFRIGAIQWPAFSGLGSSANRREFACNANSGPIPTGIYYILDRQSGGLLGPLRDLFTEKAEWFALYAADGNVDDETFCSKVRRGNFRLHPKAGFGISTGCITIDKRGDFDLLRAHLRATSQIAIPGSTLKAYGRVKVT